LSQASRRGSFFVPFLPLIRPILRGDTAGGIGPQDGARRALGTAVRVPQFIVHQVALAIEIERHIDTARHDEAGVGVGD